ncbi:MAG TPA: AMP-binding protein [Opitutaceae bacterium]|nr:AMP-binding protein [Opitutaceae bacterium]
MERAELRECIERLPQAQRRGDFVFLVDPSWGATERAQFEVIARLAPSVDASRGWLCVPTGGSSGQIRFARHDERTIAAAVSGFRLHFNVTRVKAVGVLPHHHVSGLMAMLRCAFSGGTYVAWEWKRMLAGEFPDTADEDGDWFLSLVPTQLERLMATEKGVEFMRGFGCVFIGGGPSWLQLTERAAQPGIKVSLSYGMTETAAMVCAQLPEEFAAGERGAGRPMPHATIELVGDEGTSLIDVIPNRQNEPRPAPGNSIGRIRVHGESVCWGYFPELRSDRQWLTEDLGTIETSGALRVLGRRDAVIISGGEKIAPTEVEEALRELDLFDDVAVVGVPDEKWGEIVVAFHPAQQSPIALDDIRSALGERLAAFKLPKKLVAVADWPRNAQGKVNRAALRALI